MAIYVPSCTFNFRIESTFHEFMHTMNFQYGAPQQFQTSTCPCFYTTNIFIKITHATFSKSGEEATRLDYTQPDSKWFKIEITLQYSPPWLYDCPLQWRLQREFHGFHGTPLLKGCLQKYYAQTYYLHDAHTGATHFSFTVAIIHVCQLNNFLYQELDAHYLKHVEPLRQWAKWASKGFIHALPPLQLGMAICYHYDSAYFSVPYMDNQLLCSLRDSNRSHTFGSTGSKHNHRFSSRSSNFCQLFKNLPTGL